MTDARFEITEKAMQDAHSAMELAFRAQIKNLPELFQANFEEYIKDFFEETGIKYEGKWSFSYDTVMDTFLPLLAYGYKNGICSKEKLNNFIFCADDSNDNGKTLWELYTEKEAREAELRVSYRTENEAKENGIETPCEYKCCECGAKFFAVYRSKYSAPPVCPVCDTALLGWGWE